MGLWLCSNSIGIWLVCVRFLGSPVCYPLFHGASWASAGKQMRLSTCEMLMCALMTCR